jgi:CheY-like chemotaxis protein
MPDRARALIVEDEDLIRLTLESLLVDEDFDVRVARHGAEALQVVVDNWVPDIILLDLMMPEMDGEEFRARQRQLPHLADIPVVVLSGAHEVRERAQALGAAAAIAKPFDLNDVLGTLRRVLGQAA